MVTEAMERVVSGTSAFTGDVEDSQSQRFDLELYH